MHKTIPTISFFISRGPLRPFKVSDSIEAAELKRQTFQRRLSTETARSRLSRHRFADTAQPSDLGGADGHCKTRISNRIQARAKLLYLLPQPSLGPRCLDAMA
jgi:hypothetical protein